MIASVPLTKLVTLPSLWNATNHSTPSTTTNVAMAATVSRIRTLREVSIPVQMYPMTLAMTNGARRIMLLFTNELKARTLAIKSRVAQDIGDGLTVRMNRTASTTESALRRKLKSW